MFKSSDFHTGVAQSQSWNASSWIRKYIHFLVICHVVKYIGTGTELLHDFV